MTREAWSKHLRLVSYVLQKSKGWKGNEFFTLHERNSFPTPWTTSCSPRSSFLRQRKIRASKYLWGYHGNGTTNPDLPPAWRLRERVPTGTWARERTNWDTVSLSHKTNQTLLGSVGSLHKTFLKRYFSVIILRSVNQLDNLQTVQGAKLLESGTFSVVTFFDILCMSIHSVLMISTKQYHLMVNSKHDWWKRRVVISMWLRECIL